MILVLGGQSQLARELKCLLEPSHSDFLSKLECDICDREAILKLLSEKEYKYIVNCSAYTNVDLAESDKDQAYAVNALGVENIVWALQGRYTKLIHITTDFVFDGAQKKPYLEGDATNPLSVYGKSKERGELEALKYRNSIVLRTSWLYSHIGKNFVTTMIQLMQYRDQINVVNDQVGSPTYAKDLAGVIAKICRGGDIKWGEIYHFSNEGCASWYEFACEIKRIMSFNVRVCPVSSSEFPQKAQRPTYSVLNKEKIKNYLNIDIRDWKESLRLCLDQF